MSRVRETRKKCWFGRYSCAAPELEPACLRIIHQKQKRTLVLGEVANADVLLVAGIVGEGHGALVEHFQESAVPSAVLDVRLTVGGRCRKIGRVPLADEGDDVRGKRVRKAPRCGPTRMYFPRATACLLGTHGHGKHDFVGLRVCSGRGRMLIRHRCVQSWSYLRSWSRTRARVISWPGRRLD